MKTVRLTSFILALAAAANAATLPVTTTADTGAGSLRAQIAAAASGDTVSVTATGTITLTSGAITFTGKNLIIAGPGAGNLTITTGATTRALGIMNAQCTISGITFSNCKGLVGDVDTGGAIAVDNFSSGGGANVTTISDCVFTGNQSGWGGAVDVFNGGLAMARCTFSGNTCTGVAFGTNGGGGALSLGPTLASTITNCTFSANTQSGAATGQPGGGAIYNYGAGPGTPAPITIEHCTFVGNVDAGGVAGAIRGNFTASYRTQANLRNCLLVNNQAPASVLRNFTGNTAGALRDSFASLGGNVTDESMTSAPLLAAAADAAGSSALAASVSPTLAANGATLPTHAIQRGSPAQHRGVATTLSTDQRGAPRHARADAGAFELIEPEMSVAVSTGPLAGRGPVTFGTTAINAPLVKTITITNSQLSRFVTGPLALGTPSAPAGYAISGFPATVLAGGQSATFSITLAASSAGLFNAPLNFTANDTFDPALAIASSGAPNLHSLDLSGLVTDTADHWRQVNFGAGAANAGAAADAANPTGDGIPNLLKYALGLDPKAICPVASVAGAYLDANGRLTMTVQKNPAAADVSLAIEVAGDLASWNTAQTTIDQNTPSTLQAHDNVAAANAGSRFIRLKVTRP